MLFFKTLEKYQNSVALIDENGKQMTYNQLVKEADSMADIVGHRCLVFVLCRNTAEAVVGYVGFVRKDIVPVLINADIDEALFSTLTDSYHPSYIWGPSTKNVDCMGEPVYKYEEYQLIKTSFEEDYQMNPDLALLLTTSGSTGSPKLVRQSWKNIQSNTESIIEYLGIVPEDRAITTLPMNYTYGLSIIQTHLCAGASIILTEATLMDKKFWSLLKEQKATTFGGVPYIYDILKKLRFGKMDLPSLRYLTQAGGRLIKEMAEEFNQICTEKGIRLIVMYGQTEATARMSYLPWEYAQKKAGSMGIPIPGGRFALIDVDNHEIMEPEVTGELIYFGDNVTLGYAENRNDLSKGDENHGVLHTGDMAKRDEDGFYYITGRKKRFLKIFGNRVNLDEVETLLKKEGIESVCVGKDDMMKIFITNPEKEGETVDYIVHHTGISRGGFSVSHITEIPRNASGKILYSALEE